MLTHKFQKAVADILQLKGKSYFFYSTKQNLIDLASDAANGCPKSSINFVQIF